MEVPLAVLADYANVSREGKLNIMGIFGRVFASTLPFMLPQMQLIAVLRYEPVERGKTKTVEIELVDADGGLLLKLGTQFELSAGLAPSGELPQILGIAGLTFQKYGDYVFHLSVNGEPKAHMAFSVEAPPGPLTPTT